MAIRVPQYQNKIQLDTPRVQDAPSIPRTDLSGGLSGISKVGAANEAAGEAVAKVGLMLAKHAQEQIQLKNKQIGAQAYTQYSRDLQNKLFSEEPETVKVLAGGSVRLKADGKAQSNTAPAKPVFVDETRPAGVMNRQLQQADGAYQDLDNWYSQSRNNYLSSIPDESTRNKVALMMDNHYTGTRDNVMSHQARQGREYLKSSFDASVKQQIADAYGASNPNSLNTAISNAVLTQADYNQAVGLVGDAADITMQDTVSNVVENSVMGKLKGTGNVAEANALLDSVGKASEGGKLSDENYDKLKTKIATSEQQIRKSSEHQALVAKVTNRFDMVNQVASGKLKWDNSGETIKRVALVDKDLAEAMQNVVSKEGNYKPYNSANKEYQKMVTGIFSASTNEDISKFLIQALNATGNGEISRDRLAILVNAATNRAKNVPTADSNGSPMNPLQVGIDSGLKAAMGWYTDNGEKDQQVLDDYMISIQSGNSPKEAYDTAVKTSIIKQYPEVSSHTDVPNMVYNGDKGLYFLMSNDVEIEPQLIYDPKSKSFKTNPKNADSKGAK